MNKDTFEIAKKYYKYYHNAFSENEADQYIKVKNDVVAFYFENKEIVVVIKGTDEPEDWKYNFDFHHSSHLVYEEIKSYIEPYDSIRLIGYSRGGAIALIISSLIREKKVYCFTYGQPKALNRAQSIFINQTKKFSYFGFYFSRDIVTTFTNPFHKLYHLANRIKLPSKWWHYFPFIFFGNAIRIHKYYKKFLLEK